MESPVTMALEYEPLLGLYLEKVDKQSFKEKIARLYKDGSVSYLHLVAKIRNRECLKRIIDKIDPKDMM